LHNRELIKIMREDLLKEGISDCTLANIIPTEKDNVIKISAYYGDTSVLFTFNTDTGEIISKEKGKHNAVSIIEPAISVTDSISASVTRVSRKDQIKKRPYGFALGFVLFFVTLMLGLWDNPLSFLFQVIAGVWGLALMPINQIIDFQE